MKCIHCNRELKDLYYINDKHGHQHLVGKCVCRKGGMFMPMQKDLKIPTKLSKNQLKAKKAEAQTSLF